VLFAPLLLVLSAVCAGALPPPQPDCQSKAARHNASAARERAALASLIAP